MMKKIYLVFILLAYGFASKGQGLSAKADNMPLAQFIKELEGRTPYKFFYVNSWIDSLNVTIKAENKPLREILASALQNTKLRFYIG